MRASSFLVEHPSRWQKGGKEFRLVFDSRSANLIALTPEYEAVLSGNGHHLRRRSEIAEELLSSGLLVDSESADRSSVHAARMAAQRDRSHRRFSLMPTAYCDLDCYYCGQDTSKSRTNPKTREQCLGRVLAAIADPATRSVEVKWFGGEPLSALRAIERSTARIIDACNEHGVSYTSGTATNGTFLTPSLLVKLRSEMKFGRVEVTVDGMKEVHEARRVAKDRKPRFEQILSTISRAVRDHASEIPDITLRVNVDRSNVDGVPELINEFARRGLTSDRVFIYFAPVHDWDNNASRAGLGRVAYAAKEVEWLEQMNEVGLNFVPLPRSVVANVCVAVTRSSEVLSPDGRVFSCTEYPLTTQHDAKTIATTDGLAPDALRPIAEFDDFPARVHAGEFPCSTCEIYPVCGGACPKAWTEGNPPCPSLKFNVRERIALAASRAGFTRVADAS